jgi:hypothetical protein
MSEQESQKSERVFLYVPHSWVEKALSVGWENPSDLGPPHNSYSVLMEWKRDDEPKMPFRSREKRNVR